MAIIESGNRITKELGKEIRDAICYRSFRTRYLSGKGAFCNGKRIHVSDQPLENGLVLFGTSPYYKELWKRSFDLAYAYFEKAFV